jgi:hypothetical protein
VPAWQRHANNLLFGTWNGSGVPIQEFLQIMQATYVLPLVPAVLHVVFFVVLESALEILPVYLFLCSCWPFVAENIHQPIKIHPDRLDVFRTQWLLVLAGDQTASNM